eukprot:121361_1
MAFKSIVHNLDKLLNSGNLISNGMNKMIDITDNVANHLDSLANKAGLMMDEMSKNMHKATETYPKIVQNINISILELNQVLHYLVIAIVLTMVLCCFCFLLNCFATYKTIYGVKKIRVMNSPKKPTENSGLTNEFEMEPTQHKDSKKSNKVTIDIQKPDAGSLQALDN